MWIVNPWMKSERDNWATDHLPAVATGRFAPSPTGPMHMGHLVTALSSYCSVKQKMGKWLIRIDDIDSDRRSTESANLIIETLRIHGMIPDIRSHLPKCSGHEISISNKTVGIPNVLLFVL